MSRQQSSNGQDGAARLTAGRPNSTHTAGDAALARHHSYALFSGLFLKGLTVPFLMHVRAIPALAKALPPVIVPDVEAADHYHLFGFNLFPYESIFIDDAGLLGGRVTEAVSRTLSATGFMVNTASAAADHIGYELAFMAFLSMREATAWARADHFLANETREIQHGFLHTHLLPWLPAFAVALQRHRQPFYDALGALTLDFVNAHAAELPRREDSENLYQPISQSPMRSCKSSEGKSGLYELATFMTTPAFSGLHLSRDRITGLARELQLPHGFGSRRDMLLTLLQTAERYESLSKLLQSLRHETAAWQKSYEAFATQSPSLRPYFISWSERVAAAGDLLERMGPTEENNDG